MSSLALLLAVYLVRYLSTRYYLDHQSFRAARLFGSRRMPLDLVRHAAFANLRDLAPVSFIGSWGWRGRMWSPQLGAFDTVHTVSTGLLVVGAGVPVFISPKNPGRFLQELSRRVRSYHPDVDITGPLE